MIASLCLALHTPKTVHQERENKQKPHTTVWHLATSKSMKKKRSPYLHTLGIKSAGKSNVADTDSLSPGTSHGAAISWELLETLQKTIAETRDGTGNSWPVMGGA